MGLTLRNILDQISSRPKIRANPLTLNYNYFNSNFFQENFGCTQLKRTETLVKVLLLQIYYYCLLKQYNNIFHLHLKDLKQIFKVLRYFYIIHFLLLNKVGIHKYLPI